MSGFIKDQRGFSMMELICSVAILAIVSIASSMLLVFAIRSNTFIASTSNKNSNAKHLTDRLEMLLSDDSFVATQDAEDTSTLWLNEEKTDCLKWNSSENELYYEVRGVHVTLSDALQSFEIKPVSGEPAIYRISFSYDGKKTYDKLYSVGA